MGELQPARQPQSFAKPSIKLSRPAVYLPRTVPLDDDDASDLLNLFSSVRRESAPPVPLEQLANPSAAGYHSKLTSGVTAFFPPSPPPRTRTSNPSPALLHRALPSARSSPTRLSRQGITCTYITRPPRSRHSLRQFVASLTVRRQAFAKHEHEATQARSCFDRHRQAFRFSDDGTQQEHEIITSVRLRYENEL